MPGETLSFDVYANDRASATFRKLGLAASNASGDVRTLGDRLDKLGTRVSTARVGLEGNKEARVELDKLDVKLIRLGNKVANPNITVEGKIKALADIAAVDLAMDRLNKKFAHRSLLNRLSFGALGQAAGPGIASAGGGAAGGGAQAGGGLAGGLFSNPVTGTAAIAAGLASLPFLAQAAAGGITFALGGAFAAIAAYGASKNKAVEKSFDHLKNTAMHDLRDIGKPFIPVMDSIFRTAGRVLDSLTPVFRAAAKIMAGPFKLFADTLLKSFKQPAVAQSIKDIAGAFGAILKALAPQLPGDIAAVATGITRIANIDRAEPAGVRRLHQLPDPRCRVHPVDDLRADEHRELHREALHPGADGHPQGFR